MPDQAQVTSIEALEAFRINLIRYLEKAGVALDEVTDEVKRTRAWLDYDRRVFWEHEFRRRARKLEEKQQALFSARISTFREATQFEQLAVRKAEHALAEAEEKLRAVKYWTRHYESRVAPLAKQADKLRDVLAHHMVEAVNYLTRTTRTLGAYADLPPPGSAGGQRAATPKTDDDANAGGGGRGGS